MANPERAALAAEIDRLYEGPREEFVAERNVLAKSLKAGGHADEAETVRALVKPTAAAAAVNRLARAHPDEVMAFAKSAAELRGASAKGLRAAVRSEREAAAALIAAAEEQLEGEGGAGAVLERIGETLQAAAVDPGVEELVISGRLDRERRAATVGFELAAEPAEAEGTGESKPKRKSKPKGTARAKGDPSVAERKRREQAGASKRIDRARRELGTAQRLRQRAEKRLADAEASLERAREECDQATSVIEEAERELRDRERELDKLG